MKRGLFLILIFLLQFELFSQDWRGSFSCDNAIVQASGLLADGDNIYALGTLSDTRLNKNYDVALFKFNQKNKTGRVFTYDLSRWMRARWCIKKANDGNLLLLVAGGYDYGVLKIDTAGNFLWGKWFEKPYPEVSDLQIAADGKIFLTGNDESVSSLSNGFLVSLDSDGNFLKYINFNSPFQWNAQTHTGTILATQDGGVLYTSEMDLTYPKTTMYFAKFNNNLQLEWQTGLDDTRPQAFGLAECESGFYYTGCHFGQGRRLMLGMLTKTGQPSWNKLYSTGWALRPSLVLKENKLYVKSYMMHSWESTVVTDKQLALSFDNSGEPLSYGMLPDSTMFTHERTGLCTDGSQLYSLKSGSSSGVVITSTRDFNLNCKEPYPISVVNRIPLQTISFNAVGNQTYMLRGEVTATLATVRSINFTEFRDCSPLPLETEESKDLLQYSISIYPNPSSGSLVIAPLKPMGLYELSLYDIMGKIIFDKEVDFSKILKFKIDIDRPGFYFISINKGKERYIQKIQVNSD